MKILAVAAQDAAGAVAGLQILAAQFPFDALDLDAGRRLPLFGKHLADVGQQKAPALLDAMGERRFRRQAALRLLRALPQLIHPWRCHAGQERGENHHQQAAAPYRRRFAGAQGGLRDAAGEPVQAEINDRSQREHQQVERRQRFRAADGARG
ncbi:hypothetical protein [Sulfuritalea hydrogenivorans]|uniref:hypothetical protein n=1 Tax=Sulfuritalea hydrogenivorans TaxID=748811 RepID=UPI0038B5BD29